MTEAAQARLAGCTISYIIYYGEQTVGAADKGHYALDAGAIGKPGGRPFAGNNSKPIGAGAKADSSGFLETNTPFSELLKHGVVTDSRAAGSEAPFLEENIGPARSFHATMQECSIEQATQLATVLGMEPGQNPRKFFRTHAFFATKQNLQPGDTLFYFYAPVVTHAHLPEGASILLSKRNGETIPGLQVNFTPVKAVVDEILSLLTLGKAVFARGYEGNLARLDTLVFKLKAFGFPFFRTDYCEEIKKLVTSFLDLSTCPTTSMEQSMAITQRMQQVRTKAFQALRDYGEVRIAPQRRSPRLAARQAPRAAAAAAPVQRPARAGGLFAAAASDAAAIDLAIGVQIEAHSLETTALNGQAGVILGLLNKGRYPVKLASGAVYKLKANNLKATHKTCELEVQPEPDGDWFPGTLKNRTRQDGTTFYHVKLKGDRQTTLVSREQIRVPLSGGGAAHKTERASAAAAAYSR
jgi:hypothetical protein